MVFISDIPRKDNLSCGSIFRRPHLDTRGAKEMPHVGKPYFYTLAKVDFLSVAAWHKLFDGCVGVFHCINGLTDFHALAPLCLTVFPFCFLHLNVRAVPQHNAAQIRSRLRGVNLSPESSGRQLRNHAGMVYMGMGKQHIVYACLRHRQLAVFKHIDALFHAVIDKDVLAAGI